MTDFAILITPAVLREHWYLVALAIVLAAFGIVGVARAIGGLVRWLGFGLTGRDRSSGTSPQATAE